MCRNVLNSAALVAGRRHYTKREAFGGGGGVAVGVFSDLGTLGRARTATVAPRLAVTMLLVSVTGFLVVQITNVAELGLPGTATAFCVSCVVAMFALQLLHSFRKARIDHPSWAWLSLPLLAVISFLPVVRYDGLLWGGSVGFLIASILLLVRPAPLSWALSVAVLVVVGVLADRPVVGVVYLLSADVLYGASVYTLTRLTDLVGEVHQARRGLARMEVERERLRFSRDLHDLLGYSLTAITLKGELAHRLVDRDPAQAQQDLGMVMSISRQALADLRSVARSYKELSLDMQVLSAHSMLDSAGIDVTVQRTLPPGIQLPAQVDTVLATVVREGVTNLLRHSRARTAQICITADGHTATVSVRNDGVDPASVATLPLLLERPRTERCVEGMGDGQGGLGNLLTRVEQVGGALACGLTEQGCFELRASAPLVRDRSGADSDSVGAR